MIRIKVKEGLTHAGLKGIVVGEVRTLVFNGEFWTPVRFDGHTSPEFIKTESIIFENDENL